MGIERFFNQLKSEYNIVKEIMPNQKYKINTKNLFFDFNSIIHVVSQRVTTLVNEILVAYLSYSNNCGDNNHQDKLSLLGLKANEFKFPSKKSVEKQIIQEFKDFFNTDNLNLIIIENIVNFILNLLKTRFNDQIKLICISIDGVPSKAKMVEQVKRNFMGVFDSNIKKQILEKHKSKLNKNKTDCNIPFNKYQFLINKITWSKSNIKPGTSFMIRLAKKLKSNQFKMKTMEIFPNLKDTKIIISDHTEIHEAEKKIIDFINLEDNEVSDNLCIYSPDADMILLAMLIKQPFNNIYILRDDQQKSSKITNIIDNFYNLININKLKEDLFEYIKNKSNKSNLDITNVINDIIFIFTFFGDDFIHKLETYNVKNDIKLILDYYSKLLKTNNYLLEKNGSLMDINYDSFLKLIELMSEKEDDIIKRNWLMKTYANYHSLIKNLNKSLKRNPSKQFKSIDHNNLIEFLNKYNFTKDVQELEKRIKNLISKFLVVEVLPNKKSKYKNVDNLTLSNINRIDISHFINFYKRKYNNFDYSKLGDSSFKNYNYDIYYTLLEDAKTMNNEFKHLLFNLRNTINKNKFYNKLFNTSNNKLSNYQNNKLNKLQEIISDKLDNYIDEISINDFLDDIIVYYYTYNEMPEIKSLLKLNISYNNYRSENNTRYIHLIKFGDDLDDRYHSKNVRGMDNYEKEIYKYSRMLGEYKNKLNKYQKIELGDPSIDLEETKNNFYENFTGANKDLLMRNYIDGLVWIVDYYYNDITYHKWFYLYDKAPLLQDLYNFLKQSDRNIFTKSRDIINQSGLIATATNILTPLEQLLYVVPFDKEGELLSLFNDYNPKLKEKIIDVISRIRGDQEYSDLYPDIEKIAKTVFENDTNSEIDCRGAVFLNKCLLKVVHSSIMIKQDSFINLVRETIPVEEQNNYNIEPMSGGSKNHYFEKYNKYKKLFYMNGRTEDAKKYKYYKKMARKFNIVNL